MYYRLNVDELREIKVGSFLSFNSGESPTRIHQSRTPPTDRLAHCGMQTASYGRFVFATEFTKLLHCVCVSGSSH